MFKKYRVLINILAVLITVINVHSQSDEMSGMQESIPAMPSSTDQNVVTPEISGSSYSNKKPENTYGSGLVEKADSILKSQSTCPVMGGPINKKLFVDYKNLRIYACCEKCRPIIEKQPENAILQLRNLGQQAEIRNQKISRKSATGLSQVDTASSQGIHKKPEIIPSINSKTSSSAMVMNPTMKMDNSSSQDEMNKALSDGTQKKFETILSANTETPSSAMNMDLTMKMDKVIPDNKNTSNESPVRKPQTVIYRLSIGDTIVNYTGKKRKALAINGSIPGPVLTFTEGDTAEIYIHNSLSTETSIHWHGLIVPNHYDGVPYLTTAPIAPGKIRVFRFPIVQSGTYWYHSHTGLQEQLGMYGALIIHKQNETPQPDEHVLLLSDWTDENPYNIYRNLTMGSNWYAIKRGSTQSFGEAILKGYFGTKLLNTFKRMTSMDVTDVYYNKALVNGKPQLQISRVKAGTKVRLRIINGGSSSYFWINYAGGPITVVASDGADVEPVDVDRLIIGVAETYDIIVTVPDSKSYELTATSEDRTISSSVWLGTGPKVSLKPLKRLKYFEGMKAMNGMMKLSGRMNEKGMKSGLQQMDMNRVMYPELIDSSQSGLDYRNSSDPSQQNEKTGIDSTSISRDTAVDGNGNIMSITGMDMTSGNKADSMPGMEMNSNHKDNRVEDQNAGNMPGMDMSATQAANDNMSNMPGMEKDTKKGIRTLNYTMLRSTVRTTLPDAPLQTLEFRLSGNMSRYVWTIDNKKVSERDKIIIRKGENVRIILHNGTMMRHPMHLHGHFFRVLNGQGDHAPLKTVLDIMPMETDTIEFAGSEDGDWAFHCHVLYHMMSGMGTVISYENSQANPEFANPEKAYRKYLSEDKAVHLMAQAGLEYNGTLGEIAAGSTRYSLQGEWRIGNFSNVNVETETHLGRYFGEKQWWFPYIGIDWRYDKTAQPEVSLFNQSFLNRNRIVACAGVQFLAPFLLIVDARVDNKGLFRLQLRQSDLPLTSRLRLNWLVNTNKEYLVSLNYILTQYISLTAHYDSDIKWGAGIWLRY